MIDKDIFERFINEVGSENAGMILGIFSEELEEYTTKLNECSIDILREVSHQIKSSARSLGAVKLSESAAESELAAKNNDSDYTIKRNHLLNLVEKTKVCVDEKIANIKKKQEQSCSCFYYCYLSKLSRSKSKSS